MRQTILIALAGALALGGGAFLAMKGTDAPLPAAQFAPSAFAKDSEKSAIFSAFWQQKLEDPAGTARSIASIKGQKFTVVNLWATWCTPCREEMPEFIAFRNEIGLKSGVEFVGVAIDRKEPVAKFMKEIGVTYPVLLAEISALELTKSFGNERQALPFSFVVDASGNVVKTKLGKLTRDELLAIARNAQ